MTLGRTVRLGALSGAAAGGVGAAALYWLVEPSIRAAIAIEEAAAAPAGHNHAAGDHGASHSHAVADAVVPRAEQVVFGLVTVLLVGILIGIAFALVHGYLGPRLPGRSAAGSAMVLAGLGFVAFTLAPAVVVPANPPAVGDPETVNLRALTYLGTIVCAAVLTAVITALARAEGMAPGARVAAATAVGIVGTAAVLWALPGAADPVPANVPADLVWNFRVASLAQIGLMWLVLGAVFAYLLPSTRAAAATHPAAATQSPQLIGS